MKEETLTHGMKLAIRLTGAVIGLSGAGLAWYWFGWKLLLIIVLMSWGQNIAKEKL